MKGSQAPRRTGGQAMRRTSASPAGQREGMCGGASYTWMDSRGHSQACGVIGPTHAGQRHVERRQGECGGSADGGRNSVPPAEPLPVRLGSEREGTASLRFGAVRNSCLGSNESDLKVAQSFYRMRVRLLCAHPVADRVFDPGRAAKPPLPLPERSSPCPPPQNSFASC